MVAGTVRAKSVEAGRVSNWRRGMTKRSPFRYFKTSPEIIRLAVMMYVRFPLSLWNVEGLLYERDINISHEAVRFWWNRFGPLFTAEIRKKRVSKMSAYSNWQSNWLC
jgi:putative transposase